MIADSKESKGKTLAEGRKPGRGAPRGNGNAVRHGLRGSKSPAGCSYIDKQTRSLRAAILGELAERGDLSLYREALAQSCLRHETRALLAARWLREKKDLDLEKRLALVATISRATDDRDRCLARMGLDQTRDQAIDYSAMFLDPASPQADAPTSATTEPSDSPCARESDAQDASDDHSPTTTQEIDQ